MWANFVQTPNNLWEKTGEAGEPNRLKKLKWMKIDLFKILPEAVIGTVIPTDPVNNWYSNSVNRCYGVSLEIPDAENRNVLTYGHVDPPNNK